jgi:apolipoprotein N-acyltransferase
MPVLLALLSGVLLVLSFPKFGNPAFAWTALAPLFVAVAIRATRSPYTTWAGFRLGLVTGVVYFGGTLYWTVDVMTGFGGLPAPVALPVAALLWLYLSLYVAATAALTGAAVRRHGLAGLWLGPIFWVATEWARGWIGGGFPWVPLGSSQARTLPVAQLASVTGVYGVSLLVALVGTAAAIVALTRRRAHLMAVAGVGALLVAVTLAGLVRMSDARLTTRGSVVRVGLVQGNIEQTAKWDPAFREPIMARYLSLSREAIGRGATLVVWPEASTPFFIDRDAPLAEPIRRLARETRTPFIIGTDEFENELIYNAAVLIDGEGRTAGHYRKMHLVPFGEYVPLKKLLFFVGPLVEAVSDFAPGTEATVLDLGEGRRASVAICYESTYPSLARAFVGGGAQLLMVITNDAWFGRSSAAFQHFEMGAMRAIENGRYLARAANTGITGVIDPYGRVVSETKLFETLSVTADVRLLDSRTVYNRVGDVVAWLSAACTLLMLAAWRRRRNA